MSHMSQTDLDDKLPGRSSATLSPTDSAPSCCPCNGMPLLAKITNSTFKFKPSMSNITWRTKPSPGAQTCSLSCPAWIVEQTTYCSMTWWHGMTSNKIIKQQFSRVPVCTEKPVCRRFEDKLRLSALTLPPSSDLSRHG